MTTYEESQLILKKMKTTKTTTKSSPSSADLKYATAANRQLKESPPRNSM